MNNQVFKDLVFYEIYPTSFYDSNGDGIGDLNGIREKLAYIKDLGCNAIWINPFYTSPFKDGGYDVTNFKEVDPRFGTLDDFKHLLDDAHKLGLKVIVDFIPGHTSNEHPLFIKSAEQYRNEYSDLFIWTDSVWNYNPKYKLISGLFPRHANYMVNFFAFQPALNYGFKDIDDPNWQISYLDPRTFQARDFTVDVLLFWLNLGVDGFRVDMADSLVKNDDNKEATIEVWHYIFNKVKEIYPHTFFVSEWSNPWQAFAAGFDADFVLDHDDNFYHAFIRSNEYTRYPSVLNGHNEDFFIEDLLNRLEISKSTNKYLAFISGNHDVIRLMNYATIDKIKTYYMLMMFLPGIPFIYYGDEIGMKHVDMDNKDGGYQRVGSRTPMQWNHTKNDGFSTTDKELYLPVNKASDITLEDNLKEPNSIYHFIKKLLDMRRNCLVLLNNDVNITSEERVIKVARDNYELIMNLSSHTIDIKEEIIFSSGASKSLKPNESAIIKR